MFDDMISTAGSITGAAKTLHEHGVKEIHVAATHPVLCGPAIERLKAANLASLVVHRFDPAARRPNPAANAGAHASPRSWARRSSGSTATNRSAGCFGRACIYRAAVDGGCPVPLQSSHSESVLPFRDTNRRHRLPLAGRSPDACRS